MQHHILFSSDTLTMVVCCYKCFLISASQCYHFGQDKSSLHLAVGKIELFYCSITQSLSRPLFDQGCGKMEFLLFLWFCLSSRKLCHTTKLGCPLCCLLSVHETMLPHLLVPSGHVAKFTL